jgi:hypothetical protein
MASLKAFLPEVAKAFRTTPDALYSRQRALVRLGLLPVIAGKGPGSGVPLTADTLGVMIIALLAADTLAETDERVVHLCSATPAEGAHDTRKRFVGGATFREAVADMIIKGINTPKYLVQELRASRSHGQIVLAEYPTQPRRLVTKTYAVDRELLPSKKTWPIVRTNVLEFGGWLEMITLMHNFFDAADLPHPMDDEDEEA